MRNRQAVNAFGKAHLRSNAAHVRHSTALPVAAMHGGDKISDGAVGFDLVAQPCTVKHAVAVAAAFAFTLDRPAGFEFAEDFQHRALGDADFLREVAHTQGVLGGEAEQDVGVVRQEGP